MRQAKDGNWYVCRRTSSSTRGRLKKSKVNTKASYRDWFLVKYRAGSSYFSGGYIVIKGEHLYIPENFVGKRIRLKLEIIE